MLSLQSTRQVDRVKLSMQPRGNALMQVMHTAAGSVFAA